jgi:uncharacterized protein (DUF2384 family)
MDRPYLTLDQVVDKLAGFRPTTNDRRRSGHRSKVPAQTEIVQNRRIVRRAFDIVRHDAERADVKTRFLDGLCGRQPIDDLMLVEAKEIISSVKPL